MPGSAGLGVERRLDRAAGAVRREQDVVQFEQRVGLRRAGLGEDVEALEHVERRAADSPLTQAVDQRLFVDDCPTGRVDQHCIGFEQRQAASIEQSPRFVGERQMQRHIIALGQDLLERQQNHSQTLGRRCVFRRRAGPGHQPQPETGGPHGHRLGTGSEAEQAQRPARDAMHVGIVARGPIMRRNAADIWGKRRPQASSKASVCSACSCVQKSGTLATTIPAPRRLGHVDAVGARPQPRDDPATVELFDHRRGHPGRDDQQRRARRRGRHDFLGPLPLDRDPVGAGLAQLRGSIGSTG